MNTLNRVGFLAILSLALIAARTTTFADDSDRGPISITAARPDRADASEKTRPIHHLFGDQTIELPLTIRGRSEKPLDVRARLFQRAFFLGAPLRNDVEILSGRVFSGDEPVSVSVSLPLPEVRDETDFELRFEVRTARDAWRDAGHASLRLYSREILEALKPLSENVVLRLKDDDDKLTSLLEGLEVNFVDYRAPVLPFGTPILTLIVNSGDVLNPSELEITGGESVIVFNERVRTLPKVVKSPCQGGYLIQVELEVLRNLDRDPRVQKTFMEIIELAHSTQGRRQERGEEK